MRIAVTERCIFGHCTMLECMQCGAGADELFSAQPKPHPPPPPYNCLIRQFLQDFFKSSWHLRFRNHRVLSSPFGRLFSTRFSINGDLVANARIGDNPPPPKHLAAAATCACPPVPPPPKIRVGPANEVQPKKIPPASSLAIAFAASHGGDGLLGGKLSGCYRAFWHALIGRSRLSSLPPLPSAPICLVPPRRLAPGGKRASWESVVCGSC